VDPLQHDNAERLLSAVELACEVYEELEVYAASKKDELLGSLRKRARQTSSEVFAYAVRKVFGYKMTEADKLKLEGIFANPSWISIAINQLHSACAPPTSTTSTM
jgi:vacuolar-type H+-ATPase subunit H